MAIKKKIIKTILVLLATFLLYILKEKSFFFKVKEGNKYDVVLEELLKPITHFLTQNLTYRNFSIIYSGVLLDMWYIMFLIIFTYRGLGFQEIVSFVLFYGLRAVFMNCFEFDHPDMNFNENDPGFFSVVAPHGRTADYFYSGHTGFSLLCTLFLYKYNHKKLFYAGLIVTLIQMVFITISRCHYSIDAYIGFVAAHYIFIISPFFGKILNTILPIFYDERISLTSFT